MATYKTKLIVLSRRDYGEADRLLTVYSLAHGKHTIIAKGARKLHAHMGGKIELFYELFAMLAEGRTWDILTDATIIHQPQLAKADLAQITFYYQISRLFDKAMVESESHQTLFYALEGVLYELAGQDPWRRWLYITASLLNELGYQPQLQDCPVCHEKLSIPVKWHPDLGLVHGECNSVALEITPDEAKLLRLLFNDPSVVPRWPIDEPQGKRLELLVETYFEYHTNVSMTKVKKGKTHGLAGN